jgi:HK97 family phage portal protein
MNLLQKMLANLWRPWTSTVSFNSKLGLTPEANRKTLVKSNRSWVYTCASRNAETCAAVPLRLYAEGGNVERYTTRQAKKFRPTGRKAAEDMTEIVAGHPLLEILDHPNPYMTGTDFQEAVTLWQELTGDCYIYVERGPLGIPKYLWVLSSSFMKVVPDPTDYITGYLYGSTAQDQIAFKPEEIIHLRYYNPENPYYGLSPLEAAFGAVSLLNMEQQYEHSLYKNGGMPEVAIITKQRLQAEQENKMREDYRNKWGNGRLNTGIPAFLSGEVDIKTLSHPPRDMGVDISKKFSRQDVCAAFGVPMTMIEMSEAAKAGAVAGNYTYLALTIEPKLKRLGSQLTEYLAAIYDSRLILQYEDCTPGDVSERLAVIDTHLRTGYSTINEERAIDGLDPVEWGDEPTKPSISVVQPPSPDDMPDANAPKPKPGDKPDDMTDEEDGAGKGYKSGTPALRLKVSDYFVTYTEDVLARVRKVL